MYTEARNEYMKQLCTWVVPSLVQFFRHQYDVLSQTNGKKTMLAFQTYCTEVPRWNQDIIDEHVNKILDGCRCDYVEELVTAVFIAHTKMLTAVRMNNKQKKLQITLPKLDHFLHRVFVECARALWKAPFLLSTDLTTIERQKNILTLESIFSESMGNAVRSLLPVKSILREYLDEEEDAKQEDAKQEDAKQEDAKQEDAKQEEPKDNVITPLEETKQPEKAVEEVSETASVPEAPVNEVVELVEEAPKAQAPVNEVVEPAASKPPKAKAPKQSLRLEKMDTPPGAPTPVGSDHSVELPSVTSGIQVAKEPEAPTMQIETEPSVHFTPYDTVFDTASDSEIRYTPKLSVEEKPPSTWGMEPDEDLGPTLVISNASSDIGLEDIQDLEAPVPTPAAEEEDVDAPLSLTSDFVELN
jgi:hypothetical protein